jgi:ferredoxin-nitrate reductase
VPLIRRADHLEASWDEAMGLIVGQSQEISDRTPSGALGFHSSGQLVPQEYYTLGMIGKGRAGQATGVTP